MDGAQGVDRAGHTLTTRTLSVPAPPSRVRHSAPTLGRMDTRHILDDLDADDIAAAELRQRHLWARELGRDPRTTDLLTLPPVPRRSPPTPWEIDAALARLAG